MLAARVVESFSEIEDQSNVKTSMVDFGLERSEES